MDKFKVIVVPKKGAIRGILSRPITASTRLELTKMQIIRCINSGAEVYNENSDGTRTKFSFTTPAESESIEQKSAEEAAKARKEEEDAEAKRLAEKAEEELRKQADAKRKAKEEAYRAKQEEEKKKAEAEAEAKRKAAEEAALAAEKARKEAEEEAKKAAEEALKREAELNAQKEEAENKIKDIDESIDKTTNDLNEFKAMLEGEEDEETIASINEEIKSREVELSKLNDAKSIQSMVIKNADSELSKIKK